jgi:hypothetical protein
MSVNQRKAYVVAGVFAAAVSAGTAAYVLWSRHRKAVESGESVDSLLDLCHDQMRLIEQRLGEISPAASVA